MLKRDLGARAMAELDRDRIIRFGRKRAEQGAGPVTFSIDGVAVPVEPVDLARIERLGRIPLLSVSGFDALA